MGASSTDAHPLGNSSAAFSNGPFAGGSSPTAQQNFPMLRVHIADQYRVLPPVSAAVPQSYIDCLHACTPSEALQFPCSACWGTQCTSAVHPLLCMLPRCVGTSHARMHAQVMVSPDLKDIKRAGFTFDFSYERMVEAEAAAAEAGSSSGGGRGRGASQHGASTLQVCAASAALQASSRVALCRHLQGSACTLGLGVGTVRVQPQAEWAAVAEALQCTQVEDPWASDILKHTEMGFSREEICMALAAFGAGADKDDQVP